MARDRLPGGGSALRSRLPAAALPMLVVAAAALLTGCSGNGDAAPPPPQPPITTVAAVQQPAGKLPLKERLAACESQDETAMRACYTTTMVKIVGASRNPRAIVQRIANLAWANPSGFLLPNCHGMMHTVGREYAKSHHVKLATLMNYLPQANDPACPAGFAHGLISGVAGQIDPAHPRRSEAVCKRAPTRYERYSCVHGFGHAFMRLYSEQLVPALRLCTELGPNLAPDCAGGAFHDYWFSVTGYDNTKSALLHPVTDPRKLCGSQPARFVSPCWYRAFVDNRPPGYQTTSAADMDRICTGLRGIQRAGCISAASVIGPPDPVNQLQICAQFTGPDAISCIHGTKVQNLLKYPIGTYVDVIRHCDLFPGATRLDCYSWLGKTISVITNGRFRRSGCSQLAGPARKACIAGAKTMNGPLVTFS